MISFFRRPDVELLVLCRANICRSPAGEALLRAALDKRGLGRRVRVRSAGIAVGMPGSPPDARMVAVAAELGVKMKRLRAKPLTPQLLSAATTVYVTELAQREAVEEMLPEAADRVVPLDTAGEDIPDPYYGDRLGIRRTFERLQEIAEARAEEWQQHLAAADRMPR